MTRMCVCVAALCVSAGSALAQTNYADPLGDIGVPNPNLDIDNVSVHNDLTNLYLSVHVNDNVAATNWTKYLFMIDSNGTASGRSDNPWGPRPIDTGGRLNEIFLGSWIDGGGGGQVWLDQGGAWTQVGSLTPDMSAAATGTVSWTIPLATLGLAPFQTIAFDVMTSGGGGGDPGIDHLSRADQATPGWSTGSVAGPYRQYTLIPAPGTLVLAAAGALVALRRRRA